MECKSPATGTYDPPSLSGRNFTTQVAFDPFPGKFGCPLQNMAGPSQRWGRQASHVTRSALRLNRLVDIGCARPPHKGNRSQSPQCNLSPLSHLSSLAFPARPRFRHEREGDAYFNTVAFFYSCAARARSIMRYALLPHRVLIRDAVFANRTQISGRETATTQRSSPELH